MISISVTLHIDLCFDHCRPPCAKKWFSSDFCRSLRCIVSSIGSSGVTRKCACSLFAICRLKLLLAIRLKNTILLSWNSRKLLLLNLFLLIYQIGSRDHRLIFWSEPSWMWIRNRKCPENHCMRFSGHLGDFHFLLWIHTQNGSNQKLRRCSYRSVRHSFTAI